MNPFVRQTTGGSLVIGWSVSSAASATREQHRNRRSWETLVLGALVRQSTALSVLPAAAGGDDILPSAVANVKGLQHGTIP